MPVGFNVANPDRTGEQSVKDSIARGIPMEAGANRLVDQHRGNVNDLTQEQGRLAAGASSAVQQKFGRVGGGSFAQRLEQNIRRSKARQGINNRGDAAIRNQQLKDRLQMAKSSANRRGIIQNSAANASSIKSGLAASRLSASDQVKSAYGGAAGFITGAAIRGFGDNLFNSDSSVPVETDLGTGAADFTNSGGGFSIFSGGGTLDA